VEGNTDQGAFEFGQFELFERPDPYFGDTVLTVLLNPLLNVVK
jgi:hypothetical protein